MAGVPTWKRKWGAYKSGLGDDLGSCKFARSHTHKLGFQIGLILIH